MSKKLTPKQRLFVREYVKDFNATQAAIRAGYSKKTAASQGERLLRNVDIQGQVKAILNSKEDEAEADRKLVLDSLRTIIKSKVTDYAQFQGERMRISDTEDLSEEQKYALGEMKEKTTQHGGSLSFKLGNREQCLQLLGKHRGMFVDKLDLTTQGEKITADSPLTDEERAELERLRKHRK